MDIRVDKRPATFVAFFREKGPFKESTVKAWQRMEAWLATTTVVTEQTEFMGVMHDNPETTPPEEWRYDACITVPSDFESPDKAVQVQELAAGDYAVTVHVGPYEKLGESWYGMMPWLKLNNREMALKPCFEVYQNDPRNTPPEALRTALYLPLKPQA